MTDPHMKNTIDDYRRQISVLSQLADDLKDPFYVYSNMVCGLIAKPSIKQLAHAYGDAWPFPAEDDKP